MFTVYRSYDDEGYFLLSLKDYMAGHPLFTQALPIYGPFYYEVVGGIFKVLGVQPSQDSGRLFTLVVWLAASALAGVLVHRVSRVPWLAVAGQVAAFCALKSLVNEPIQPAGVASLLLLVLMVAATFFDARPRLVGAVIGGAVGALVLVKVNLGVFAGAAVAFEWAASLPRRWRRLGLGAMAAAIVALPVALMAGSFDREWVVELAVATSLAAAAVGVAVWTAEPESTGPVRARWLIGGGAAVVVVCVAVAVAGGTSLGDMWTRPIAGAVRFPDVFTVPVPINVGFVVWSALWLAAAVLLSSRRSRRAGTVRIAAGILIWLLALVPPLFALAPAMAWIAAVPPRDGAKGSIGGSTRALLAALAVAGSLQIFPVAGTQVAVASLLLLPVGAIALGDGLRELGSKQDRCSIVVRSAAVPGVALAGIAILLVYATAAVDQFSTYTPLQLPGSELLRQPAQTAGDLRSLVATIDQRCTSFITLPGMDGFYFWTRQAPPAEVSSEVWWLVLDGSQQQSLVDRLRSRPGLCVVKNEKLVAFWAGGRRVPQRPLVEFIDGGFVSAGKFGDYELLVRRPGSQSPQ